MEPLSPQDPLYRLLGKARAAEPRPNFTQNVVRAARQLSQKPSFLERLDSWVAAALRPIALGVAAVVLVTLAVVTLPNGWRKSQGQSAGSIAARHAPAAVPDGSFGNAPTESEVASEVDGMNQLGVLLAQRDPSTLSDSEIGALLY